ncbi:MAG: hypothetical protein IJ458_01680 [Clostridia bacterium]|nr:hypothetical protein [Clostridia bacterium]
MINLAFKPINTCYLKQNLRLHLKRVDKLESIHIFSMPTKIRDSDISAMFNGLLALLREKVKQEQNEKYLLLKLKYARLKSLYNKTKKQKLIK